MVSLVQDPATSPGGPEAIIPPCKNKNNILTEESVAKRIKPIVDVGRQSSIYGGSQLSLMLMLKACWAYNIGLTQLKPMGLVAYIVRFFQLKGII